MCGGSSQIPRESGGFLAVTNYTDFYDGSWDDEANDKNELGTDGPDTSQAANYPFTGCDHDGTEGSNSKTLGETIVRVGLPNNSDSDTGPLSSTTIHTSSSTRPFYGLSPLFQVGPRPTSVKVRFGSTGYHANEGGAETTVVVSMYPRPNTQVDIPLTVTSVGTTTAADYEIYVNGSLETSDRFTLTFSPDDIFGIAGAITKEFTVKAVTDSANDHRDSVRFRFGAMPDASTTIEGETDARAAKTATVWLLETQTETMDCTTADTSAPNLGNLRNSYNPRRRNSRGEIENSGDCVWFKVPGLATNRRHQIEYSDRWVQGVLSEITSPQIKIYNSDGTPLVQDGSAVEDQVLEADRRFRAPLIRFTPATYAGPFFSPGRGGEMSETTDAGVDSGRAPNSPRRPHGGGSDPANGVFGLSGQSCPTPPGGAPGRA